MYICMYVCIYIHIYIYIYINIDLNSSFRPSDGRNGRRTSNRGHPGRSRQRGVAGVARGPVVAE